MIMATIEERVKRTVREHYNCNGKYPCSDFKDCVFGSGCNTAWDCEECGADEFEAGYLKGATEQHKIDIEKAKVFTKRWLDDLIQLRMLDVSTRERYQFALEVVYAELEKAMEE